MTLIGEHTGSHPINYFSAGLIAAAAVAALSFGVESMTNQGRAGTATTQVDTAGPAARQPGPIPEAGPASPAEFGRPGGLPAGLTREVIPLDNLQTPETIALGEMLFF